MNPNFDNKHLDRALDYIETFKPLKDPISGPYCKPDFTTRGDNVIVQQLNILTALVVSLHNRLDQIERFTDKAETSSYKLDTEIEELQRRLRNIPVETKPKRNIDTSVILGWKQPEKKDKKKQNE